MKVATYNVNSIKARCDNLCQWLKEYAPDLVFLQEIKCETENFLYFEFESLGYKVVALGQKSYNGVAILCKYNFEITAKNLPAYPEDSAARYLEVLVTMPDKKFYAVSVYAPNGCSPDKKIETEKLNYKLYWYDKFYDRMLELRQSGYPIIIGGDFNIMMQEIDVYDSRRFLGSPLYRKEVQDKLSALNFAGFYDAFRLLYPVKEGFTFWDYTANSFVTNLGLRIDYLFMTAEFATQLTDCWVDTSLRAMNRPSDHTALVAQFREDNDTKA